MKEFLFKTKTEWQYSIFYFDSENNIFLEERYHEEYLDTGTVCDGISVIEDSIVWRTIVREANEDAAEKYFAIRKGFPVIESSGISLEEFLNKLHALSTVEPHPSYLSYKYERIGECHFVHDENNKVILLISKCKYFWILYTCKTRSKYGFSTFEEALSAASDITKQYNDARLWQD